MTNLSLQREVLKTMVRSTYDMQKLRIQTGNRIVASFKSKLGQAPSMPESDLEKEAKRVIDDLRLRYRRITDGVAVFPRKKNFKGDDLITDYSELCLLKTYFEFEEVEAEHFRLMKPVVETFPIYREFLEGVYGVGPAISAILITEIDIHNTPKPSSLWALCGLDVVPGYDLLIKSKPSELPKTGKGLVAVSVSDILVVRIFDSKGNVVDDRTTIDKALINDIRNAPNPKDMRMNEKQDLINRIVDAVDYRLTDNVGKGRSKRAEHLVEREYIDKNGEKKTKLGVTFKPFLKTKLMGVLATSFLKQKSEKCKYRMLYDQYKFRTQNRPDCKDLTPKHVHNRSMRYAVKIFLVDLYTAWRELEGLPVYDTYGKEKLGLRNSAEH